MTAPLEARRSGSAFRPRDVVLLLLLATFWGHSFLFIKMAVSSVPPVWIVTTRMTVGGVLLMTIVGALRRPLPRDGKTLATLAFVGIVGGGRGR
ncbi:MAG TPA: EamA family transporter [Polyangiaceae bacterium]|jgi:drug/metabolite transporter (DMT)-like permease|nr:EamA family transporter [Polyangiaceae bacterium]